MNKYTKQGRGRNRSEQPRAALSGLARRLLSRNDITVAVLETRDAPHQVEPIRSARELRRHHDARDFYTADPVLGRARMWMQTTSAFQASIGSSPYFGLRRHGLKAWAERRNMERAQRNPYSSFYDSPTGRQYSFPEQADIYRMMHIPARLLGQNTARQQFLDGLVATDQAAQQVRVVNPVQFGTRGLRVQRPGMVYFDTEMINRPLQNFAESFARVGEAMTEAFRRVAQSPAFEELAKAEREAAEKAEIEKRLAGRTPGEVIRRPRRSILGMYVIDEVQEDGHIARKVVQPQGKKGSS